MLCGEKIKTDDATTDHCTNMIEKSVTQFHIGQEQIIVSQSGAQSIALAIGSRIIAQHFRHIPPTEAEMENAIMLVEDELSRIRHAVKHGATLVTTDTCIRDIAVIAGIPDQPHINLSRELVEQTFNRLAAIVQGRPASLDAIPIHATFCASLLILRECMHHLDFASIEIIK